MEKIEEFLETMVKKVDGFNFKDWVELNPTDRVRHKERIIDDLLEELRIQAMSLETIRFKKVDDFFEYCYECKPRYILDFFEVESINKDQSIKLLEVTNYKLFALLEGKTELKKIITSDDGLKAWLVDVKNILKQFVFEVLLVWKNKLKEVEQ